MKMELNPVSFAGGRYGAVGFDVSAQVVTNNGKVDVEKLRTRIIGTLKRRILVEARRDIQREYAVKSAALRERLSILNKYHEVTVRGHAFGVNLINFGARQNRKGVTYRIFKAGGRKTMEHAFIRRTRSGKGPYVWLRDRVAPGRPLVNGRHGHGFYSDEHGYPIFGQYGPNVAAMLRKRGRPQRLADFASGVIASELARLTR